MPDETRKPDAVLIPTEWRASGNVLDRIRSLLDHAERIMGEDPDGGAGPVVRPADGSHHFASRTIHDTFYFPKTHDRSGQPRYRWERQEDGSVYGYYVDDEARATGQPAARGTAFGTIAGVINAAR